jgi:O-antigen ligase
MVGAHPLLGNGLASTVTWQYPVSTHNIYLYFAADYGLIGLFVFPGLVLAACYARGGSGSPIHTAAAAALLCLGLFSHNIATVYPVAMFMALLSTLSPADADAEGKVAPASRLSAKGSTPPGSAVSMQTRELQ